MVLPPASGAVLRIRIDFPDRPSLGPGKVRLLETIGDAGSISAAARDLGMSYRRAWLLVEELNAMFADPLVTTQLGGKKGGGAVVTEAGLRVIAQYRQLEEEAARATGPLLQGLEGETGT
ncbi:winged helix-turn-helix domain-containing protein [Amorphus coralli]|uniref:winged helix-turn-helix domain-containing protein n=1 Tax=Amorphus coralli TaxID=340680 RepID=UPI0003826CB5|nr:LysR family transcriptional regulator [Amorphus coralli]